MRDDSSGTLFWGVVAIGVLVLVVASAGTRLCVNNSSPSSVSALDLSDLASLKIEKSNVVSDLLDLNYWSSVATAYRQSLAQIIPGTVLGFVNSSVEWRSWAFENMPSPPSWLRLGINWYLERQLLLLQDKVLAADNGTVAALLVKTTAASIAGYSLAILDFVSFNGVTALKTYIETGSLIAAICATFPSQLGVLYNQAFDSSVTKEKRAQYLGNALAITSLMIVLAGKDGFAPKFQDALSRVGLADAWDSIKPYLAKIGSTVSARASSLTFNILEKLASRFPQGPSWMAGFTTDRIESMVEVLQKKGVPNDIIEEKISGLMQAADSASSPDGVADDADIISYSDGGGLRVKIGTQNRMYLYSDVETMRVLKASILEKEVQGFHLHQATLLQVKYWEQGVTVYHSYEGGDYWTATVPDDLGKKGDVVTISVQILTREDFVKNLPEFTWANENRVKWLTDLSHMHFSLDGDNLNVFVTQDPEVEGLSEFVIGGVAQPLKFHIGVTYLDFGIAETFGDVRPLRISYNGYGRVSLGIGIGDKFGSAFFLSNDGVRLRVLYNVGQFTTRLATLYLKPPSVLYSLGDRALYEVPSELSGVRSAFLINNVNLNRALEQTMLKVGSTYDAGRLGAEIAYTIATERLGLKDVVMVEPAQYGTDLFTRDGNVVIQARLLTATQDFASDKIQGIITGQLLNLLSQLDNDFTNHPSATTGYAVLSYVDNDQVLKTIVLEVPKP